MTRHVALLRAINVGGKGQIRMAELRAIYEAAGARDVATYIASGNVLFSAPAGALPAIRKKVHAELVRTLGDRAAAMYRTAAEMRAIAESDPFRRFRSKEGVGRYVLFFGAMPKIELAVPHWAESEACDVFALRGLHAFVVSHRKKTGYYGSPNRYVEDAMGVVSTARSWSTVTKLAALCD